MAAHLSRAAALLLLASRPAAGKFSFLAIGDWGGATLGGYQLTNAHAVAKQLGQSAKDLNAQFVVNTGDNFYYCGVSNLTDSQFKADFEDIYTDPALSVPWYGVLGNHDYGYSVEAQLNYKSPTNDRWQIPSRYFSKRMQLGGSQYMTMIFLDTNPCIQAYRADDPKGWDPCSGEYGPECIPQGETTCEFHAHILEEDCGVQYAWLQKTVAAVDPQDWLVVVGHHPAEEIDVNDLTSLFIDRAQLYLNGHDHLLMQYRVDGRKNIDFITSGGGCMVEDSGDDHHGSKPGSKQGGHSIDTVYQKTISGFTTHTFSDDFSSLTTTFVDKEGNVLRSIVTMKSGAAPVPKWHGEGSPAPSPQPGTSCKAYGCGKYEKERQCQCNYACAKHGDCCSDYQSTCGSTGACKDYGCGRFDKSRACQCNDLCGKHNDCCTDYETVCKSNAELVM